MLIGVFWYYLVMAKEFYTTKEFAEILGISFRQVIKLIKAKKIRAINISLSDKPIYRILCKEYLRFVAEQFEEEK